MKIKVSPKRKYVYWPIELRKSSLVGSLEVIRGVSVLVLVKDGRDPDEIIQSLDLIIEGLKLKRESLGRKGDDDNE